MHRENIDLLVVILSQTLLYAPGVIRSEQPAFAPESGEYNDDFWRKSTYPSRSRDGLRGLATNTPVTSRVAILPYLECGLAEINASRQAPE